jgi:drug/metabolite transporter (DMT)-like permease
VAKNVGLSAALYSSFVLLFYRGVGMAGPNIAALMFTVGAVFSAFFAVVLLGEQVSWSQLVGAAMLIGGAVAISIKK